MSASRRSPLPGHARVGMLEREVKLVPPPGFQLPDLDGIIDGLTAVTREPQLLQATYYDTIDLRLARAGASLRYRNHDGWTVKLPGVVTDGVLIRAEHAITGSAGRPPVGATDLLRGYLRTARPGVVARLRTRRLATDLVDSDGKRHVEIVDDEVSVLDGRRVSLRFREIEIEMTELARDNLATKIARELRRDGAGPLDLTPKIVRALGPRALEPPDVAPSPPVSETTTAGEVVRFAITASVQRLISCDAGVRLGEDPEILHQARVATRRLRSDLRTFASLVDETWSTDLRAEVAWLTDELGAVRDSDVLTELLTDTAAELDDQDRSATDRVLARIARQRRGRRGALAAAMRSPRYAGLLDRLVEAARAPVFATGDADRPAAEVLPRLVSGPWRHLRDAVNALDDPPSDSGLHDVRIRAKRCRYAAEAVAPVVGKPARRFARRIAAVQDVLGRHQDVVVATEWLRETARAGEATDAFAAGALAGVLRAREQAARADWSEVWRAASRAKLRSWW